MTSTWRNLAVLVGCAGVLACKKEPPEDPTWRAAVEKFRAERAEAIAGEEGWITLVGRFALKEGSNPVGSAPDAVAVLPPDRSPAVLGTVTVEGSKATFEAAAGVAVGVKGQPVTSLPLDDDEGHPPTVLEHGSLRLHVIRRGGQFFLRVKDRAHPARAAFTGLTWFPLDPAFRVTGRFVAADGGATVDIVNVLNQTKAQASPGTVRFRLDSVEQQLIALKDDGPGLFLIFKDQTAGAATYPSGRFLDTKAPAPDGTVELDFNQAYSPPCAFTAFATCPLPPPQNHLAVRIAAGEQYRGAHAR